MQKGTRRNYTIALSNQKGGVGKSTTAVNLAAALGEKSQKCLIVDLDSQGSASLYLGAENNGAPLLRCLLGREPLTPLIVPTTAPNVDIVPGGIELADAATMLPSVIGSDSRLKICLEKTEGDYDWIFLDCPPGLGILVVNAMVAADGILVPTELNPMALPGMSDLGMTISDVREGKLNPTLGIIGVVPCRCQTRRVAHRELLKDIEDAYPGKISPIVRENVAMMESFAHQKAATTHFPNSIGANDYRNVADWLLQQNL